MTAPSAEETTKERILRIAAELFAEKGYAATGVAELSTATGLGKGALYHHIASKEDLLFQLSKRHIEESLENGEAIVELDITPVDKLRLLSREQMRAIAGHLAEVTLYFREGHALTGERREALQRIRERWETVWERIFEEGVEAGVFRPVDPVTLRGVLGIFNYSWVWFRADGALSPEEVADELIDLVLLGTLAERDAGASRGQTGDIPVPGAA